MSQKILILKFFFEFCIPIYTELNSEYGSLSPDPKPKFFWVLCLQMGFNFKWKKVRVFWKLMIEKKSLWTKLNKQAKNTRLFQLTTFDFVLAVLGQVSWLVASVASLGRLLAVPGQMTTLVASVASGVGVATRAATIAALVWSALWSALLSFGATGRARLLALAGKVARLSAFVAHVWVTHFMLLRAAWDRLDSII